MYQHDVSEKLLTAELSAVVQSCVCSVGVDLNTASAALLERIAPYEALCLEHASGTADRTAERAAYRAEIEAAYEALCAQPMGTRPLPAHPGLPAHLGLPAHP